MTIPFFYEENLSGSDTVILGEDTSKHIVQVLRMNTGDRLKLTDGNGLLLLCQVEEAHKKHCSVAVIDRQTQSQSAVPTTIAISLVKNPSRFEWFLEKATELGVNTLVPLICERTEKERFRYDRMKGICISAMLQSQQTWLPELFMPQEFDKFIKVDQSATKLIAHCEQSNKMLIKDALRNSSTSMLIGPEGDFTSAEIRLAVSKGATAVSLGATRLRTETAGIAAAVWMSGRNH